MISKKKILFSLYIIVFLHFFVWGENKEDDVADVEPARIMYLLKSGKVKESLDLYQKYYLLSGKHNLHLIQDISLGLLEMGYHSSTAEEQLLAVYGAGISVNEKALRILEVGMDSIDPQVQLASLSYLSKLDYENIDRVMKQALNSPYLPIRLEAFVHFAKKNFSSTVGQVEALIQKVPPSLIPIFPQIYAMIGTREAIRVLQKFLVHSDESVRVEAVKSVYRYQRDDLLPQIRTLSKQHGFAQQAACAIALGEFHDVGSCDVLESLSRSSVSDVQLAALYSLYSLGKVEVMNQIYELAEQQDLYAIHLLGQIGGGEDLLVKLMENSDPSVRTNATIALLKKQDERCVKGLSDILIRDKRDFAFLKNYSIGGCLGAFKAVSSGTQQSSRIPLLQEMSLSIREEVLNQCVYLKEETFLEIAKKIFDSEQEELVLPLVHLLENIASQKSISLLKSYQQKLGAPFVRNLCNLALFRLKEKGSYWENIKEWITQQQKCDFIRFRPQLSKELTTSTSYKLNPHYTSLLLIESFETIAQMQNDESINILLNAIKYGNEKNKYPLAGLLMRASQ